MTLDFGLSEPGLLRLASNAFRLHGAFRVVPKGKGAIRFEFTTTGKGVVKVEILEGKSGRRLLSKEFTAPTSLEAFYRASDAAVLATTDAPGFFSGKLTYVSKGARGAEGKEVFVADALFSRAQAKTNFGKVCCNASWSADGQGIFFTSDKSRFNNVYYMDFAAGDVQTVAQYRGSNLRGVQSPTGRNIAYILSATGNPELWLGSEVGGKLRQITRNKSNESGPCWHPDGNQLVITSDILGQPQLFKVDLRNGKMSRIYTNKPRCSEAAWNPRNPQRLAFTFAVGGGFQIGEYDFTRGKTRQLTSSSSDAMQPVWANDGRHLFFTERRKGSSRLMILDTKGDGIKRAMPLHGEKFGNCSQASFHYPSPETGGANPSSGE